MTLDAYELMVGIFPETKYILLSTQGKRESFHGFKEFELCRVATVNVFFLPPEIISHLDHDSGKVDITDHHEFDRLEIAARLRYEGASIEHIQRELNHPNIESVLFQEHFAMFRQWVESENGNQ